MADPPPPAQVRLRLGTRQSPLAMAQAKEARNRLCAAHGWAIEAVELVPVRASGDKIQDRPLADIGGKALWTRELDIWLAEGRIDAAVHSMKDVETIRPESLVIATILPREDVRDVLIGASSIRGIAQGGRIGTSAPRRAAQMLHHRPDCRIVSFRGNVATRLAKLAAGEADVTLLAAAGLNRVGRTGTGTVLEPADFLPAPAQGAIGLECNRSDDRTSRSTGSDRPSTQPGCGVGRTRFTNRAGRNLPQPDRGAERMAGRGHRDARGDFQRGRGGADRRRHSCPAARYVPVPRSWANAARSEHRTSCRAPVYRHPMSRASTRPIIVLRPQPGLAATLRAGRAAGLNMHGFPLFEIVPVAWTMPDIARFDAMLAGSANVFRHGGEGLAGLRALPVHAVGETTAEQARKAGFVVARVGTGGLQSLLDEDAGRAADFLRLGGEARVALHPAEGQVVHDITVYRAEPQPLPDDARPLLARRPVATLHSAAAAVRFRSECDRLGLARDGITIACLGSRIADAAGHGWHRVLTAPRTCDAALLELLVRLCESEGSK